MWYKEGSIDWQTHDNGIKEGHYGLHCIDSAKEKWAMNYICSYFPAIITNYASLFLKELLCVFSILGSSRVYLWAQGALFLLWCDIPQETGKKGKVCTHA